MKKITKKQSKEFVESVVKALVEMGAHKEVDVSMVGEATRVKLIANTTAGALTIKVDKDNVYCYTVFSKFVDVQEANGLFNCNPYSGKYNLHFGDGETPLNELISTVKGHFDMITPHESEPKTKVKFLVNETDKIQDVFAFFPEEVHNGELKTSYSHIGQHSACSEEYANESRDATPEERKDLQNELENSVGYNLEVLN